MPAQPTRPTPKPTSPATHRRRRSPQAQDDFRRQILDLARGVFERSGGNALTIRAVTAPLGVSQMAFYAYFPSKDDLVRQIWIEKVREQFEHLLAAGQGQDSNEAILRRHLWAYIDYWEQRPAHYRRFMLLSGGGPGDTAPGLPDEPIYQQMMALHRERVMACIGDGRADAATIERLSDLAYVKAVGYLHLTLGMERFPERKRETLRQWVIDDIVDSIRQAAPA